MAKRSAVLLWIWLSLFAMCGAGIVLFVVSPAHEELGGLLSAIPIFVGMGLGFVTYRIVRHDQGTLVRTWLYRVLVGSLLLTSTATFVASGSTVVLSGKSPVGVVGLVSLGTFNVLVAVLAWRALTMPTPRRAARVGALAIGLEVFALLPDIANDIHSGLVLDKAAAGVAALTTLLSMGAGALACVASVVAFGGSRSLAESIPVARVVD